MSRIKKVLSKVSESGDDYEENPVFAKFFVNHRHADRASNDLYEYLETVPEKFSQWSFEQKNMVANLIRECTLQMNSAVDASRPLGKFLSDSIT